MGDSGAEQLQPMKVVVDNPPGGDTTVVRCKGDTKGRGQLAKMTTGLSSFGLDIKSAFIRSEGDGRGIDNMFYVVTHEGEQLPPAQHDTLKAHILEALGGDEALDLLGGSSLPNIYGAAVGSELSAIKNIEDINGDVAFMAAQLERAAVELAASAAQVVAIERASAKLMEAVDSAGGASAESLEESQKIELSRLDARSVGGGRRRHATQPHSHRTTLSGIHEEFHVSLVDHQMAQ
jgi:hypothetical protein